MSDILSFFDWPTIDLDPLVLALSSLDINKMASKNLFYINRLQDIGRGVFENFWNFILVKISAFDIPKFRVRFPIFRTCLGYIRIKVGIFWNLFSFEPNQNFSKWIPQMPFCCVSRNSFLFFIFGPFWTLFVFLTFFQTHLYGAYNKKEVRNVYYHIRKPFP